MWTEMSPAKTGLILSQLLQTLKQRLKSTGQLTRAPRCSSSPLAVPTCSQFAPAAASLALSLCHSAPGLTLPNAWFYSVPTNRSCSTHRHEFHTCTTQSPSVCQLGNVMSEFRDEQCEGWTGWRDWFIATLIMRYFYCFLLKFIWKVGLRKPIAVFLQGTALTFLSKITDPSFQNCLCKIIKALRAKDSWIALKWFVLAITMTVRKNYLPMHNTRNWILA